MIGFAFDTVFFMPVSTAPDSRTCCNSEPACVIPVLNSSELTSCSSCAFPSSCCLLRSSTISLVKKRGDF